jgi:uncharacterized protein (DUF427 family)
MIRATWNGEVLAESDDTVVVEGNHYFPAESIRREHFSDNPKHTTCAWKGVASYYNVEVDGQLNAGAAWTYPDPEDAAESIRGHVAFWRGVKVEQVN